MTVLWEQATADVPLLSSCQLCICDGGGLGPLTLFPFESATEHAAIFILHVRKLQCIGQWWCSTSNDSHTVGVGLFTGLEKTPLILCTSSTTVSCGFSVQQPHGRENTGKSDGVSELKHRDITNSCHCLQGNLPEKVKQQRTVLHGAAFLVEPVEWRWVR